MAQQPGNAFGANLKSLRETRKLQKKQLAQKAGVSRPYLTQLESGQKDNPSDDIIERLAVALDVPSATLTMGQQPIAASLHGVRHVTAASEPEMLRSAYAGIYFAAGAVERLTARESNPDPVGEEIPPPEFRDELGVDPIGVIVDGESLAGLGIHTGMVAWVNTTDRPYYRDGDVVLANVRGSEDDDLQTVIKQVGREEGRQGLYSVPLNGGPVKLAVSECWVLARVVCVRARTPMMPRAFQPGTK